MALMVLADHNAWSFMEQAMATTTAVLVVVTPILYASWRANKRLHDRTFHHVNNLEEGEAVPDGVEGEDAPTLGSVLRQVERKVDTGFQRNDETHEAIIRTVEAQGELLHDHGRRLDAHRTELDQLRGSSAAPHPRGDTIPPDAAGH